MNSFGAGALASVLMILGSGSSYAGLLAYYPFDSDFNDASGNLNDLAAAGTGTPAITSTLSEVKFGGGALDLEQTTLTEFLTVPGTTDFNFASNEAWSVSFWAKRRSTAGTSTGMVMGDTSNSTSFIWINQNAGQGDGFRFRSLGNQNTNISTANGSVYHHWALVADGTGKLTVYWDGNVHATSTAGTSFNINAIGDGYNSNGFKFDGQLDELYVFDEAINAAKVSELFAGVPDKTPPTLVSANFVDNRAGRPVTVSSPVTYTLTFSEDMDAGTISSEDFGNAGDATYGIGAIKEKSPGVFSVEVMPTSAGTLQLQINQDAILSDPASNDLDTSMAILDDTIITVELSDSTPPTLTGSDFADNRSGGPVTIGTPVTYTISFSEDMDANTVDAADFGNAGTAGFSIGTITEVSPGVFTVMIAPTSAGTLQLQVKAGAILTDAAGKPLGTSAAITSHVIINVEEVVGPSTVKRLRVFLLGGQSNADGRAALSELPTSPVNLQLPQEDVDFHEGSLTTLRPYSQFGPEVTLGRRLADSLGNEAGTRVAIIKYAVGGTNLYSQWVAGGDATTTGDGPRYVSFQGAVTSGLAALAAAYPNAAIETEGMLWVQGESDAGTQAVNYETNLRNFIADIRLTYGSNLRFVVSRLSSGQTAVNSVSLATIRAAQSAVAAADPLTALLDTDGFGMKTDNLHFNGLGQQQIGNGSAAWLLDFMPFLKPLEITPQPNGDLGVVVDLAFDGFLYTLQGNPDLQAVNWGNLETKTASGSTVTFSHKPGVGVGKEFFRVTRTMAR